MALPELKYLSKLIDLCRKKGVSSITIDGMCITISDTPPPKPSKTPAQPDLDDWKEPSQEELLFWSAQQSKE